MLKSVGLAVESITAHFSPSRDPEEKIRLGNSLLSPAISQLVLGQLCPAIKNILQDGLKAFKLDLIVGQRRNKPWSVVEALTQPGIYLMIFTIINYYYRILQLYKGGVYYI
uniref:RUN domain-containing protein n=1 Tax=Astyanax mexicanus TaxID=7994 RepID=A0A8B9LV11_ASTMX